MLGQHLKLVPEGGDDSHKRVADDQELEVVNSMLAAYLSSS